MNPPLFLHPSPGWRLHQARETDRCLRLRDLRRSLRRTHFLMRWVPRDTWVAITCGPVWALMIILALALDASVIPGVIGFLVTYGALIALERVHKELQLQERRLRRRLAAEFALRNDDHERA